jgi:hypothetical protein
MITRVIDHDIETCVAFKRHVGLLIKHGWISFDEYTSTPNLTKNPLPYQHQY